MSDWTDAELTASVRAYRRMQKLEAQTKPYSKKGIYDELAQHYPRTAKAFEYRMQNISAVLHEAGDSWLKGLKPAGNVGANVQPRIEALLKAYPNRPPKLDDPAPYKAKLPAIRSWLIAVARSRKPVTYSEIGAAFDIDRFSLKYALKFLGNEAANLDEPILTALVVSTSAGKCGEGFAGEFNILDDEAERQRLYDFWTLNSVVATSSVPEATFVQRCAKFVSVEARPDQAAFRRRVFEAQGGRCVISGCDIVQALDAAHKVGRSWRKGHNQACDGYVMRKDLHALYDHGLLRIAGDGHVTLDDKVALQYALYSGMKICLSEPAAEKSD